MWLDSIPLHLALVGLVAIGGIQDWRKREVSNLLTIPHYLVGMLFVFYRFFQGDILPLAIIAVLTLAAFEGWMGGADYKVLAGLFGTWPEAGLAALLISGIWGGVVVLMTRSRQAKFPGVTAMAMGVVLIFLMNGVIYLERIS